MSSPFLTQSGLPDLVSTPGRSSLSEPLSEMERIVIAEEETVMLHALPVTPRPTGLSGMYSSRYPIKPEVSILLQVQMAIGRYIRSFWKAPEYVYLHSEMHSKLRREFKDFYQIEFPGKLKMFSLYYELKEVPVFCSFELDSIIKRDMIICQ